MLTISRLGFAICIAKLSDIYGRRNMVLFSWIIFIAFSLACALSKNMTSLYVDNECQCPVLVGLTDLASFFERFRVWEAQAFIA